MKPGEAACRPLYARLPQSLVAPQRLFLAAPRTQAQQQRRNRPRIARPCAIDAKPQAWGLVLGAFAAWNTPEAPRPIVGLLGRTIEALLHLLPVGFEVLRGCIARDPHNGADGKA